MLSPMWEARGAQRVSGNPNPSTWWRPSGMAQRSAPMIISTMAVEAGSEGRPGRGGAEGEAAAVAPCG
eukprot:15443985-Heterocapsa_arctica.AAC.1